MKTTKKLLLLLVTLLCVTACTSEKNNNPKEEEKKTSDMYDDLNPIETHTKLVNHMNESVTYYQTNVEGKRDSNEEIDYQYQEEYSFKDNKFSFISTGYTFNDGVKREEKGLCDYNVFYTLTHSEDESTKKPTLTRYNFTPRERLFYNIFDYENNEILEQNRKQEKGNIILQFKYKTIVNEETRYNIAFITINSDGDWIEDKTECYNDSEFKDLRGIHIVKLSEFNKKKSIDLESTLNKWKKEYNYVEE